MVDFDLLLLDLLQVRTAETRFTFQVKGSVKEPNISIYFFYSAHPSMAFYFRCSVYWWKGVSDFSVLKYYLLNINYYSVNILSECLRKY